MDALNNFYSIKDHQFCSEVLQVLNGSFGIKQVFTSPYHPQTNGLIERMNILAYVDPLHQLWDQLLSFVIPNQLSKTSKCYPKKMTQLNGGFISNSVDRCFDVHSNTIYVWHNNNKRNTIMHLIHQWSYKL